MKVLKWFRYGFLGLGFFFLFFFIYAPNWKFLPLKSGEDFFFQIFIASTLSFIAYATARIIELCKSKNKFEPLILYYIGFIMSCVVYSNFANNSPMYYFLEQPLSDKLTPLTKETIAWVYFILTTLLFLIGIILEFIKVCKTNANIGEKSNLFLNVIIYTGLSFVWIRYVWRMYRALSYIPYVNIAGSEFSLISNLTNMLYCVSIPLIIIGIVLKFIYIFNFVYRRRFAKNEK